MSHLYIDVLCVTARTDCIPSLHRYSDDEFEYRHVQLPKPMLKAIPKEYFDTSKGTLKLLWEDEWRSMGITQVRTRRTRWSRQNCGDATRSLKEMLTCRLQSLGWEHYEVHEPEPHILLFKYARPFLLPVCARDKLTEARPGDHLTTSPPPNERQHEPSGCDV